MFCCDAVFFAHRQGEDSRLGVAYVRAARAKDHVKNTVLAIKVLLSHGARIK